VYCPRAPLHSGRTPNTVFPPWNNQRSGERSGETNAQDLALPVEKPAHVASQPRRPLAQTSAPREGSNPTPNVAFFDISLFNYLNLQQPDPSHTNVRAFAARACPGALGESAMSPQSIGSPSLWLGFIVFVIAMLAIDLGIFHRKSHVVSTREALVWSGFWIGLALLFNLGVWKWFGPQRGMEFLTGYLIEKSLSIDNIFVFVVIFGALGIPALYQHRVLFWGILSALLLRAGMIFGGTALLTRFHWLIYVFGAFLVFTGAKLFLQRDQGANPQDGGLLRLARRLVPSTEKLAGEAFFTVENGRRVATPLFMALLLVEGTDVVFAVDSIPAIFAVTNDPFVVFTSNIFAILGLRSLFFLLAGIVDKFRYLKVGLAIVLVFVGLKMSLVDLYKVPAQLSLLVIGGVLMGSILASLWASKRESHSLPTT
jgi:tellurite resistance protein TerC